MADLRPKSRPLTSTEVVQGKGQGEGQQPDPLRAGENRSRPTVEVAPRGVGVIISFRVITPIRITPSGPPADPIPSPLFQQSTYDKLMAEVPKYKMITISILCDRLRITCSLARKAIAILIAKGEIKPVTMHSKQQIYTRATNDVDA